MKKTSIDIIDNRKKQLAKIMPEIFTENKIDWEKLKASLGRKINFENERYVLNWAGKSEAFSSLQSTTFKTLVLRNKKKKKNKHLILMKQRTFLLKEKI